MPSRGHRAYGFRAHVPTGLRPAGTCPGMTGEFTPNTSLPSIHTHSQFSDYFLILLDFHPSRTILLPSRSGQEGASRSSRGGAGCDGPVAIVRPFARKAISEECAPRSCRETSGSRRRAAQGPSKRGGPRFSQSPLRCGLLGVASRKIVACGTQAYCCIRGLFLPCALPAHGAMCLKAHGAAGAVKRPVVPHALSGKRNRNDRQALGPDGTRGDDACPDSCSPDER